MSELPRWFVIALCACITIAYGIYVIDGIRCCNAMARRASQVEEWAKELERETEDEVDA